MSDNLYDVDPEAEQEDEEGTKSKIATYALIGAGVIIGMFVAFWLMMRMNYKVNAIRDNFRPTLKIASIVIIVFIIVVAITMFLINIIGKKGAYDKHYTKEKPIKK